MSNITVTTEQIEKERTVELILDQQVRHVAVNGTSSTIAQLLNAIFKETGQEERVVSSGSDGTLVLDDQVYVLRDGAPLPKTTNGNVEVFPGDTVVVDREHQNG